MRRTPTIVAFCLCSSSAAAQQPRPMGILDLINLPRVSDPRVSPDAKQVLYVQSEADWKANKRVSHIWRIAATGGTPVQMTNGTLGETSPRWSPDGRHIAFVAQRGDAEAVAQIHLMPADGGEARALTTHATAVSRIEWSPDGGKLFFVAAEPKTADEKAKEQAKDDVVDFDEDYKQQHLWQVDVATRQEARISDGAFSVLSFELSRDGKRVVLQRAPNPLFGDAEKGEIWVMDADGKNAVQVTANGVAEGNASLSPDGATVLFVASAGPEFQTYYNGRAFMAPAAGGAAKPLFTDFAYDVDDAQWSKDGKRIFLSANMGVHSQLFEAPVAGGRPRQLTDGVHAIQSWSYDLAADRHAFVLDSAANPGEVFLLGPTGAPVQVTKVHDGLSTRFQLPKREKVAWKGADGVTVEGVLTYPADHAPGKRAPLIVNTHGGPAASSKFGFGSVNSYLSVAAGRGYAILEPNYRGSTGYGDAFLRDMVGSYFKNSHLDVMKGADHVIGMGLGDPDRMIKMGWSAGGHMTNKIITFTDRFKAAASGAGAANWVSMYAQSDVRTYRTPWFGGTPWQKNAPIDLFWEHSPLKYVANVKTPTLFLVGDKDVRVPPPQSVEMHRALKANGVPTRLYIAPREPHGWQELRHQLFKANVELDWFEKHALGRTYTWEKAPAEPKENAK